jgi:uncharacterized membrane protein
MNSRTSAPTPRRRWPDWIVGALVVLGTAASGFFLTAFPLNMHVSFTFSAYDVGMHLQALWKFSRLEGLFNTIRGLNYWGDHLWIAYAMLAPAYRLWPSPMVVYAYQGFGLAAGGLAVYALARRKLRSRTAAVAVVMLYCCYPGLIYSSQENFHPEVIGSTWLLLALWAHEAGRARAFWASIVLALLTKEDIALYSLGFAAWLFLRGDRRRGIALGLVAGGYFLLAMRVLLPWFNGVGFFRAGGGYWFSTWAANWASPSWYASVALRPETAAYTRDLLWPVAYFPLAHPLMLVLLAGPAFLVNNVAGAYLVSIHYHYLYGIIPGIFAATIATLATLERLGGRWIGSKWLRWPLGALVLAAMLYPTLRFQWTRRLTSDSYTGMAQRLEPYRTSKVDLIHDVFTRLPADARVSASHNLVPFVANRNFVFMFPNPWRVMYWGIAGENTIPPETIDTLLLDRHAIDAELNRLADEVLATGFEVVVHDQGLLYAIRRRPETKSQIGGSERVARGPRAPAVRSGQFAAPAPPAAARPPRTTHGRPTLGPRPETGSRVATIGR